VIGAFYTVSRLRKRMQQQCEERIAALKEGIEIGEHLERNDHVHS
jgi:hypothetical protein